MARKILIVDDNAINRLMLRNSLCRDYDIIEAGDGEQALRLMYRHYKTLSAVLLDIVMPGMDGYQVLQIARENALLAQIPIIMVTGSEDERSRVKALSLGANDFILKPFNPAIVKHCLRNNISLRETASILNAIQKDKLTGLYNREAYFDKVAGLIRDHEPGYYVLSCFDIDNFKLINDQYGAQEGDRILCEVGRAVAKNVDEIGGIAGRISADNFSALFPVERDDTYVLQRIQEKKLVSVDRQSIAFSIGRYVVTDLTLPASAIYDRAYIAKQSVKGRYDKHLAYFDDAMLEKLVREQQITGEMEAALQGGQFEAWFQPQYDHATGALLGAEALARWRHPQKGIIPPGEFVPLFEQNGFVYELDKHIWGEVCRYLRRWMDEGLSVLPVSVNISRYDIFRADLISVLTDCLKEYDIPVELVRLEITESAFATSTLLIVDIVKRFIQLGFTVEIDDFGSGYSSLNTLKDVPAQVVKLDMHFLEGDADNAQRGGNILESIVRMTKWLGMSVLAEGVEDRDQADFLKSIGCSYVQGYLYARPMPAREYEALLTGTRAPHLAFKNIGGLPGGEFWDPKSIDTLIFNSFSGGGCVYEFGEGRFEMIRVTDKYVRSVFDGRLSAADLLAIRWYKHVDEATARTIWDAVRRSARDRTEEEGDYVFYDLPGCAHKTYLRSTLRVIASTDDGFLVYITSQNVTAQREEQQARERAVQRLTRVLNNMDATVFAFTCAGDSLAIAFANGRFCALLGYTMAQLNEEQPDLSRLIHSADRARALETVREKDGTRAPYTLACRLMRRDQTFVSLTCRATVSASPDERLPLHILVCDVAPAGDRPA